MESVGKLIDKCSKLSALKLIFTCELITCRLGYLIYKRYPIYNKVTVVNSVNNLQAREQVFLRRKMRIKINKR